MPHPYDLLEPGLALSGAPRSAAELEDAPFTGILNVSDFHPPRYGRGLRSDIALVRRPINDIYPIPLPYLALAVSELAELRRQDRPTLVHCHAGRSRSPSVIALYWMARDGMSWDEALARVRAHRDVVNPNVFFETDRRRAQVIAPACRLLAGDAGVLDSARQDRETLIRTFQDRPADPADPDEDWNLVEEGLVVGGLAVSPAALAAQGIRTVVVAGSADVFDPLEAAHRVAGMDLRTFPLDDLSDLVPASEAVAALMHGREKQAGIAILSPGDEFAGALLACACLMRTRDWDVGTAMWYVGSRRASLWSHVHALWTLDWESPG